MAGTLRVPSSPPFISNNLRCGWNVPERTSRHRLMHRLPSSLTDDSNTHFSVFLGPAPPPVPLRLLLLVESCPRLSVSSYITRWTTFTLEHQAGHMFPGSPTFSLQI